MGCDQPPHLKKPDKWILCFTKSLGYVLLGDFYILAYIIIRNQTVLISIQLRFKLFLCFLFIPNMACSEFCEMSECG